jgi:hypothetical protein
MPAVGLLEPACRPCPGWRLLTGGPSRYSAAGTGGGDTNLAGLLCRLQPLTAAKFPLGPTRPRQPLYAQTREQHMSLGSRARSACSMPIRSRANPAVTLTLSARS